MKQKGTTMRRLFQPAVLALTAVAFAASGAEAQQIDFQIDTYGCFHFECTPTTTNDAFVYNGDVVVEWFGVTGFTTQSTGASPNTAAFNLGTFNLNTLSEGSVGTPPALDFRLKTVFTAPSIIGTPVDQRTATFTGSVNTTTGAITFALTDPTPAVFSFTQGPWAGTFEFMPDASLFVDNENLETLGGLATVSAERVPVPEPASMLLMATGMLGVFGVGYRRRNA